MTNKEYSRSQDEVGEQTCAKDGEGQTFVSEVLPEGVLGREDGMAHVAVHLTTKLGRYEKLHTSREGSVREQHLRGERWRTEGGDDHVDARQRVLQGYRVVVVDLDECRVKVRELDRSVSALNIWN